MLRHLIERQRVRYQHALRNSNCTKISLLETQGINPLTAYVCFLLNGSTYTHYWGTIDFFPQKQRSSIKMLALANVTYTLLLCGYVVLFCNMNYWPYIERNVIRRNKTKKYNITIKIKLHWVLYHLIIDLRRSGKKRMK